MKTFTLFCLLLLSVPVTATHLRGGYIEARSVSTTALTYEITVTVYGDEVRGGAASGQAEAITLCFGDGSTQVVDRTARIFTSDRTTSTSVYRVVHTYAGPGTYTLSTALANRTIARNLTGSDANGLMTLTTTFTTNGGSNHTPALDFPTNGYLAATNRRLVLLLNTTDAEGDSLVHSLTRPLTSESATACSSRAVTAYQYPNDLTRRGTFRIDSRSGTLTWDAPVEPGNYSVAVTVREYRRGLLISQTQFEISLVVADQPGTPGTVPPYEPALEGGIVTGTESYGDEDVRLTVFPNPVDDRLQVVVQSRNSAPAVIRLIDANGRTLHELAFKRPARQHEQVISLESLTPGTYVVRAEVGGRSLVRKVVKK